MRALAYAASRSPALPVNAMRSYLSRMICGPSVAVCDLVTTNLSLNRCRHLPADPRDHDETVTTVNALLRVTIILDLCHRALSDGQIAVVSVVIDSRWRNYGMDRGLVCIHDYTALLFETACDDRTTLARI